MKKNTIKSIALAACLLGGTFTAQAQLNTNGITHVIYILLENRNWSQNEYSYGEQIMGSTNDAPFLNALVTAGNPVAAQVSFASCYHHVLAKTNGTSSGTSYDGTTNTSASVHPSEPNYVWMEAGNNFSKYDDNEPYKLGLSSSNSVAQMWAYATNHPNVTTQNLSALIQQSGLTWKSYTEGVNQLATNGSNFNYFNVTGSGGNALTASPAPSNQWTVPVSSFSGTSTNYVNPYNGSHQYNFAVKHTGQIFFPATSGCTVNTANTNTSNPLASNYPPLPQFASDLTNGTLANYVTITPDQYNDGHTALTLGNYGTNGWTNPETTSNSAWWNTNNGVMVYQTNTVNQNDRVRIAQMDNFCAIIVGQITNSAVYQQGHTAIVIWTDETETSLSASNGITPQNDFNHTLSEIVISPLCKGNAYNSLLNYTHSSDIATMQKIFGVTASTPSGYLNDAANASYSSGGMVGTSQTNGNVYSGTPSAAGPATATNFTGTAFTQSNSPTGGFGTNTALDLSDLFQSNVIPATLPGLPVSVAGLSFNHKTGVYTQAVTVKNTSGSTVGPVFLVLSSLGSNYTLTNKTGNTVNNSPGSPYINVTNSLGAGAYSVVTLQYTSTGGALSFTPYAATGTP